MRQTPKYLVSAASAIKAPLTGKRQPPPFSIPSTHITIAQTQNASINTSDITVVLETMKTGVASVASAASKGASRIEIARQAGMFPKSPPPPATKTRHAAPLRPSQKRSQPTPGNNESQRRISTVTFHIGIADPYPVHFESVWIPLDASVDLPGGPDKERIIHVERLGQKCAQSDE